MVHPAEATEERPQFILGVGKIAITVEKEIWKREVKEGKTFFVRVGVTQKEGEIVLRPSIID